LFSAENTISIQRLKNLSPSVAAGIFEKDKLVNLAEIFCQELATLPVKCQRKLNIALQLSYIKKLPLIGCRIFFSSSVFI
jgi:hypothetical protein